MAQIDFVLIQPIEINPELELDDFDRLRIESIVNQELKDFPFPFQWQNRDQETPEYLLQSAQLKIELHQFSHSFHESEGQYLYSNNSPMFHTGYSFGNRHRHRRYRSSGFGVGISISPGSSSRYVSAKTYNSTEVELRFTLTSANGETTYWIYNEENITDPTTKALAPDDNLKKIVKNGLKSLKKQLKEDQKSYKKMLVKEEMKND